VTDVRTTPAEIWDLRRILRIFARRWFFVIATAVIAAGVAFVVDDVDQPQYEASAQLLIEFRSADSLGGAASTPQDLATELVLVQGQAVRGRFEERLGQSVAVETSALESSSVIEVQATSANPRLAAAAANAYAQAYVDLRDEEAADEVASSITTLDQELAGVNASLAQVEADLVADPFSEVLSARRDALIQQQISAQQTRNELAGEAGRGGPARVSGVAEVPSDPVAPDPVRSALIAGALAMIVASALLVLLDRFDDSIDSVEDLELVLRSDLPIIAEVPEHDVPASADTVRLMTLADSQSTAAEAYRSLRTTLQFVTASKPMRSLLVTSSLPQEGKTTTAANLAVVFAQAGMRVIALDADLRRPRLDQELIGEPAGKGLTDVLDGSTPLTDAAHPVVGVEELVLIGAGSSVPNPAEVLSGVAFAELLDDLAEMADLVVVDTSPVLLVSDPLVLTGRVDAVIVVSRAGSSTQRGTRRAVDRLLQVDAPLVGAVLNGTSERDGYQYGYGYGYGYAPSAATDGEARDREGSGRRR
jgi:capsular exopolysaccharide synthesis family protein